MQSWNELVAVAQPIQLRTYLRGHCGMSARLLTRLKRQEGGIRCNGKPIRTVDLVHDGDLLELRLTDSHLLDAANREIPVAYEDAQLVVFDKPTGMPVHPSVHHQGDTLGNCFSARYPGLAFRAVNRLDRDTSGLCLCAKSAYAANQVQFCVQKRYYAVVCGILTEDGTVDAPIARAEESIILRQVSAAGREAVTHYHILGHNDRYTALALTLETGRTHCIAGGYGFRSVRPGRASR